MSLHALLALFVSFHAYPATQDGPAHLYGAHIVGALKAGESSIYSSFFASNLHAAGNSLFTYFALFVERFGSIEWAARLAVFAALVGMPLALIAFTRALRAQAPTASRRRLPDAAATSLGCFLAYNYFTYRGLFNYALAVPLALLALAALVGLGTPRLSFGRRAWLALASVGLAYLAALAHPAATAFLLVAVVLVSCDGGGLRKLFAALIVALLLGVALASRISRDAPSRTAWVNPLVALQSFVRALGLTLTWAELVPAMLLLGFALVGARRGLASPRRWFAEWSTVWPALLGGGMALGYFFVPFEYGGAAGLNERIPLFSVLLLLPYVALTPRLSRWLPPAFVAFAVYTGVERVRIDGMASAVRDSTSAQLIPRGSVVYAASLRIKMGAVSADLGRHVLADVARRRDLIAGTVFASHPAHVLRATSQAPPVASGSAVQGFEHLSASERAAALGNPNSPIRRGFEQMRREAQPFHYLLVVGEPSLNAAFERFVTEPLGARLLSPAGDALRVYAVGGAA